MTKENLVSETLKNWDKDTIYSLIMAIVFEYPQLKEQIYSLVVEVNSAQKKDGA